MTSHERLYSPEQGRRGLRLTEEQKDRVRAITLGVEEVDPAVREMALEDVVKTLENGHPLNRLVTSPGGELVGYVACEDFVPHEAYVKYFATSGGTGRNPLREVPAFLEHAKSQGYLKINFHGWNARLNRVLERFGFARLRTDRMGAFAADFYEKDLQPGKTAKQIDAERRAAFEQKFLAKLARDYENTLATFSAKKRENQTESPRERKTRAIEATNRILARDLSAEPGFALTEIGKAVLKLKIARHLQTNDSLDTNVLRDAILETPSYLETDKGSLARLLEIHEEKTIQIIAERRKRKAEQIGDEGFNPYEALFTTVSGNYYLARLINMPHLEQESDYMKHCVGNSDSYINKMKRGDVEILSLRRLGEWNDENGKYDPDLPVMTIEYNVRTGTVEQMKKADDAYLEPGDEYYPDVMDALRQLPGTTLDSGKSRRVARIQESELVNLTIAAPKDGHVATPAGEISVTAYRPEEHGPVFKMGHVDLAATSTSDLSRLLGALHGVEVKPNAIARTPDEITGETTVFVGDIGSIRDFFQKLPDTVEHVFTSLEHEPSIRRVSLEVGGVAKDELKRMLQAGGEQISPPVEFMIDSGEFAILPNRERVDFIRLTVRDLGFPERATTDQIFERAAFLGLELCPPETGPEYFLRFKDQPMDGSFSIGMRQVAGADREPRVFYVGRHAEGVWVSDICAYPVSEWEPGYRFLFRLRKNGA